jgi:hypothetical protein
MLRGETGAEKLGQPVPESNFALEEKRSVLQQMHEYIPGSFQA